MPDASGRRRALGICSWLILSAAIALATAALFTFRLNTDVAWLLFLAERMAAGEQLYVDRIEVNLPWVVYLSRGPTALGAWLHISNTTALRFTVLAISGASVFGTVALLRPSLRRGPTLWVVAASLWLLLLWMAGSDIGEREHLLALALVPYVALRCRDDGPPTVVAVAIGLAAGVAVALKPHFLPVWMAAELDQRIAGQRWIRPESVSAAAVLALSVALLPLVHPEYFGVLRDYGSLYREFRPVPRGSLILVERTTLLAIAAAILIAWLDGKSFACVRGFVVAAMASLVIAVWQGKGFTYHLYPAHVFAAIALVLLLARPTRARHSLWPSGAIAILAGAIIFLHVTWAGRTHQWLERPGTARARYVSTLDLVTQNAGADDRLLALTPHMLDVFPLVNIVGISWSSRYNALWPVVSLYRGEVGAGSEIQYRRPSEMTAEELLFFRSAVEDLLLLRPTILLVDEGIDPILGGRFDFPGYLVQDSAAARALARYAPRARRGQFQLYRLAQ